MIVSNNETYVLEYYKHIKNSAYEYEQTPTCYFFGRPANRLEIKNYRVQQGVQANSDSVFIVASNLPAEVKANDRIVYLGKVWTVESVGYYFDASYIVNAKTLSNEYVLKRLPKGLTLS